MSRYFPTLALLLCSAAPVQADITPQALWQHWQDISNVYDLNLQAGSQDLSGDKLELSSVTATLALGTLGEVVLTIPQLTLHAEGGAVLIDYPPQTALTYEQPEQGRMDITLTADPAQIRAEGDAVEIRYLAQLPSWKFNIALTQNGPDGALLQSTDSTATIDELGFKATSQRGAATGSLSMQSQSALLRQEVVTKTATGDLFSTQTTRLEDQISSGQIQAEDGAFVQLSADGTIGRMLQHLEQTLLDQPPMLVDTSAEAISATISAAAENSLFDLAYSAKSTGMSVTGFPGMAVPIALTTGDSQITIHGPFELSETPRNAHISAKANALTFGPELWDMFDPEGHIDRTPGALALSASTELALLPPGETPAFPDLPLKSLTLKLEDLLIALGGATLKGTGDFTFEPGEAGQPELIGTVDLSLENGLALIDNLVAAGLIPDEQLMGLRMMLGVIARPDGSGDRLISNIALEPGRNIVLNGMRVQIPE